LTNIGFNISLRDIDKLYPHFLSHPLGMDLHESYVDERSQSLTSGMIITIEPGTRISRERQIPQLTIGLL